MHFTASSLSFSGGVSLLLLRPGIAGETEYIPFGVQGGRDARGIGALSVVESGSRRDSCLPVLRQLVRLFLVGTAFSRSSLRV